MSLPGIEAVVTETLTILKAGMATKLASFSYADGLTPAAPADDAYFWYVPKPLPSPPLIIVMAQPESADQRNIPSEIAMTYAVQVDVVTRAGDVATSEVQLWRYWRAVKELLLATQVFATADCVLIGVDWSQPTITDRESGDELLDIPGVFHVTTYETP